MDDLSQILLHGFYNWRQSYATQKFQIGRGWGEVLQVSRQAQQNMPRLDGESLVRLQRG
jgi:hypothetical protein